MKAVALRSVRKVQEKELMGRFTQVVRRRLGSRSTEGKSYFFYNVYHRITASLKY